MKAKSHIFYEVDSGPGSHGQTPSKPSFYFVMPTFQPVESILDYQKKKFQTKKNGDPSFYNDLTTIEAVISACSQASKRSSKINLQNCAKLQEFQPKHITLQFELQRQKFISDGKDKELEFMRQYVKNLEDKIASINETHKKQLAEKDDIIKSLEITRKNQNQEFLKFQRDIAQKLISAVNSSNDPENYVDLAQIQDPQHQIQFALQQIADIMKEVKKFQIKESLISEFINKLNKTPEKDYSAVYGNLEFKNGQDVSIFGVVQDEIPGMVKKYQVQKERIECVPLIELRTFLQILEKNFNKVRRSWGEALRVQKDKGNAALMSNKEQWGKQKTELQRKFRQEKEKNKKLIKEKEEELKRTISESESQLFVKNNRINSLEKSSKEQTARIKQLQSEIKESLENRNIAESNYKNQMEKIKRQKEQQKTQLIAQHNKLIIEKQGLIKNLQSQNASLRDQIRRLKEKSDNLQTQVAKMNRQFQIIGSSNSEKDKLIQKLERQIQELKKKITQLYTQLSDQTKLHNKTKKDLSETKTNLSKLASTYEYVNADKLKGLEKIQELEKYISNKLVPELQDALKKREKAQKLYKHIVENPPREYLQYFNGNILNYNTQDRLKWFVTKLEEKTHRTVKSTKLLYRFDRKNMEPFHNYIDHHENIVLVVKVAGSKQIIAGYSKCAFIPKTNVEFQEGYMFGLVNEKVFQVKKEPTNRLLNRTNPKPITYDDCYLLWGNADIRIKSGTNELFSTYATPSGSYEELGNEDSVIEDLFMHGERETALIDYEVFAIDFFDY